MFFDSEELLEAVPTTVGTSRTYCMPEGAFLSRVLQTHCILDAIAFNDDANNKILRNINKENAKLKEKVGLEGGDSLDSNSSN